MCVFKVLGWLDIVVADEVKVMKGLKGNGRGGGVRDPTLSTGTTGNLGLLVILFLLLLNLTIVLCMRGDITAVSIRLLKRLPLLGIA